MRPPRRWGSGTGVTSPCTTCTDLHRPCPCPGFLRWDAAANPEPEPDGPCLTCIDAEFLLMCGETLDTVAARLRIKPASLRRRHLMEHLGYNADQLRRLA